jgi:hypothetical protein
MSFLTGAEANEVARLTKDRTWSAKEKSWILALLARAITEVDRLVAEIARYAADAVTDRARIDTLEAEKAKLSEEIAALTAKLAAIGSPSVPVPEPTPSTPALAAITIKPVSITLRAGDAHQFVHFGWLEGADTPHSTPVKWSATGGTIDTSGRYVAGNIAGEYKVTAQSIAPGYEFISATAAVSISQSLTLIAHEGQSFTVPADTRVAYGANGVFHFKTLSGTVQCDNATFGDPIFGIVKACYVEGDVNLAMPGSGGGAGSDTADVSEFGSVAPTFLHTFSTDEYANQAALDGDTDSGSVPVEGKSWFAPTSTSQQALDNTQGHAPSTQCLKYTHVDREGDGIPTACSAEAGTNGVGRNAPASGADFSAQWRLWFSDPFQITVPGGLCDGHSGAELKLLMVNFTGTGGIRLQARENDYVCVYPVVGAGGGGNINYSTAGVLISDLAGAAYARFRISLQLSTDASTANGRVRWWVGKNDDQPTLIGDTGLIILHPGMNTKTGEPDTLGSLFSTKMHSTFNQGPWGHDNTLRCGQWAHWHDVRASWAA